MTENAGFALSSDPNKDPSKPVKFDHGEPDAQLKARQEAEKADVADPLRTVPDQMRPENQDPTVTGETTSAEAVEEAGDSVGTGEASGEDAEGPDESGTEAALDAGSTPGSESTSPGESDAPFGGGFGDTQVVTD